MSLFWELAACVKLFTARNTHCRIVSYRIVQANIVRGKKFASLYFSDEQMVHKLAGVIL